MFYVSLRSDVPQNQGIHRSIKTVYKSDIKITQ